MSAKISHEYGKDFYAWAVHNAELMRQGRFSEMDMENVAEELESMGKSNRRELVSRLSVLIAHLLKWQAQSEKQSNSWKLTVKEQRIQVRDLLEESPSLKSQLENKLAHAYELAILIAARETGLAERHFPKQCPFTIEECLKLGFFPKQN